MLNNFGPRTEPCGAPQGTPRLSEYSLSILTLCVRPVRNDLNHRSAVPPIPISFSRISRSFSMSIVSNAALRSRNIYNVRFKLVVYQHPVGEGGGHHRPNTPTPGEITLNFPRGKGDMPGEGIITIPWIMPLGPQGGDYHHPLKFNTKHRMNYR